jgi:hypothetical protein
VPRARLRGAKVSVAPILMAEGGSTRGTNRPLASSRSRAVSLVAACQNYEDKMSELSLAASRANAERRLGAPTRRRRSDAGRSRLPVEVEAKLQAVLASSAERPRASRTPGFRPKSLGLLRAVVTYRGI